MDRQILESLINENLTISKIADKLNLSQTTIAYWLKKHGLRTKRAARKTSAIWRVTDEEFKDLIKNSKSVKEILSHFGLQNKGNNFKTVKSRIVDLEIDTSHFMTRLEASNFVRKVSVDDFKSEWLVENSSKSRGRLKAYLIKFNFIKYQCNKCQNSGEWMGEPIILQLEHINGVSNDNRIENLCFLCPNCHSQTSSYAGRNIRRDTDPKSFCVCGRSKDRVSNCCGVCRNRNRATKIEWPSKEFFETELWIKPTSHIAKELGVSDKAVEKKIKQMGLTKPPRGYWSKVADSAKIKST